jgi:hypothetical protein
MIQKPTQSEYGTAILVEKLWVAVAAVLPS